MPTRRLPKCKKGRKCGRTCIKKRWNCYTLPANWKGPKPRGRKIASCGRATLPVGIARKVKTLQEEMGWSFNKALGYVERYG